VVVKKPRLKRVGKKFVCFEARRGEVRGKPRRTAVQDQPRAQKTVEKGENAIESGRTIGERGGGWGMKGNRAIC